MNDILILDNIVPNKYQDKLEQYVLGEDMEWYFLQDITKDKSVDYGNYGMTHNVFHFSDSNYKTILYYYFLPIIRESLKTYGRYLNNPISQIRCFLQLPIKTIDTKNLPHQDDKLNHLVVLYYLTDSDGDTYIYNETEESEEYTIKATVTPKKGRVVIFPGKYYHNSSKPTNNVRCILNANILI